MTQFDPTHTYVRNPREAAKAFWRAPKQRSTFLVRFNMNGIQTGADQQTFDSLKFVARSVDRPKINPKTEELHQYNKKRQVYTGYKLEPVRMQFYDTAGAAMAMWKTYAKYHFGDFTDGSATGYEYDITGSQFLAGSGAGFGFTGSADASGQFYFKNIEIYHFYDNSMYDGYQLVHPRITMFEPDDLDFENSAVSLISMTVNYENLQYALQKKISDGDISSQPFSEFTVGNTFSGDVLVTAPSVPDLIPSARSDPPSSAVSADTSAQILAGIAQGTMAAADNYRYNGASLGGALGLFGNFAFGPGSLANLGQMALNNLTLAAALDIGAVINPLAIVNNSMQAVINTAGQRGIDGATYDVAMGRASAVTSGYGDATNTLTTGLIASTAISGDGSIVTPDGVVLNPQSYGAINAAQSGTAQYGYNTSTP